eukprot:NODE_1417_length_868_cov_87.558704_g1371_i0.p1 GENE.NODE_1417_length_868_cov_87.558704_g1371_i0~~NODE_1417_length_868_cov_87.558704_g1371_i0.p1  ORF type:complete len:255 (-),score=45.44 NODE_1417_length_868_cov_87.558704_g1371_i0:34-798(-)
MQKLTCVLGVVLIASSMAIFSDGKMRHPLPEMIVGDSAHNCSGVFEGTYGPVANGETSSVPFNCSAWGSGYSAPWGVNEFLLTKFNIPEAFEAYGLGWFTGPLQSGQACTWNISLYDGEVNLLHHLENTATNAGLHIAEFSMPVQLNAGVYYILVVPGTSHCAGPECGATHCRSNWYWHQYSSAGSINTHPATIDISALSVATQSPGTAITTKAKPSNQCQANSDCGTSCCCYSRVGHVCTTEASCVNLGGTCH